MDDADDRAYVRVQGVPIPRASKRTLLLTKRTLRPSDEIDRRFLEALMDREG